MGYKENWGGKRPPDASEGVAKSFSLQLGPGREKRLLANTQQLAGAPERRRRRASTVC